MAEVPGQLRVAHLSSAHNWDDVRIFGKQARSLATAGYSVSLIAQREGDGLVDNVRCIALPIPRNRFERMLVGPWRVFWLACHSDICHFHDPELIPVGLALKVIGKTVIYDVHEDVPRQIRDKHWIPPIFRRPVAILVEFLEWIAAISLDRIVAATPTIAARFPNTKTVIVQNFPRLDELTVSNPTDYEERLPQFAYIGNLSRDRGAIEMVEAMAHVGHGDAKLLLAGRCTPEALLDDMQCLHGWRRVEYHQRLDRGAVGQALSASRAGIVLFRPIANHLNAFPTKFFEYMSVGLPVVASDFPLWRDILEGCGGGLLVDPHDPEMIAESLMWILGHPSEAQEMGRRGQKAVLEKYNWDLEEKKLLSMYASLS